MDSGLVKPPELQDQQVRDPEPQVGSVGSDGSVVHNMFIILQSMAALRISG